MSEGWDLLESGTLVAGRYRITKPLARGGFGAVYVAEQLATEKSVALKVLWPHIVHASNALEKLMLEARVAGRVSSEHIVQVLDAGVDPLSKAAFLVMELLEGTDLEKLVASEGPLGPEYAVEYLRQVASGLDKAHGHVDREGRPAPIVHRDLKPENLFLTHREDGTPLVKILDFGIAKVLSKSTRMSGDIKGTPLYMAYEQASQGKITPATDIWSFGLIAFYLLTGRPYWVAATSEDGAVTQLFGEIIAMPFAPASVRARELGSGVSLSSRFDEWFFRCVDRDPAKRFERAGKAALELAIALGVSPRRSTPLAIGATMPSVSSAPLRSAPARSGASPLAETLETQDHAALGSTRRGAEAMRGSKRTLAAVGTLVIVGGGIALAVTLGSSAKPAPPLGSAAAAVSQPNVEPEPPVSARAAATPLPEPSASVAVTPSLPSASARPASPAAPKITPPKRRPTAGKPSPSPRDVYGER